MNYLYNAHGASVMICGLGIIALGAYILFRNPKSLANRSFFLLCLSLFIWLVGFGLISFSNNEAIASFWARIIELGVVFIPANIFFFVSVFLGLYNREKPLVLSVYFVSFFFFAAVLGTNLFVTGVKNFYWGYYNLYGPLGYVYIAFFVVIMLTCLQRLWNAAKKTGTNLKKKQIFLVFFAIAIAYLASVDFLPHFGISVYPFGYMPIFIFAYVISYAMVRYGVFSFTPAAVAENLISTMADAVFLLDIEGDIILTNEAACRLLGASNENLLNTRFLMLVDEGCRKEFVDKLSSAERCDDHYINLAAGGEKISVGVSWNLVSNGEGDRVGVLLIAHDMRQINELIEKEKSRVTELDKLKGELEEKVKARTIELEKSNKLLEEKLADLEQFHGLAVGRELKMDEVEKENIDLKQEIEELKRKLL